MSGGVGSRLWPLSREDFPKQFHDLSGKGSMLLLTMKRLLARGGETQDPVYVLGSGRHADRIREDVLGIELAGGRVVLEPMGRNTAAAVVLATEITLREHGDNLVLVVPSDHEIRTDRSFWETVERGTQAAADGRIVVFGIRPDRPETGFGYIEVKPTQDAVLDVARFVEKPDAQTAQTYIDKGNFYWNAGIFLFRASAMRDAFLKCAPDIWNGAIAALDQANDTVLGTYLPEQLYAQVPSISVDYAIMERTSDIALVPATFRWNDLGSWQSLLDVATHDDAGNVVVGDVVAIDCEHSYLRSSGGLLTAIGLRDMAVVATADATFVAPVSQSQNVRKIVEQLEKTGRLETRFTQARDRMPHGGASVDRIRHWLFKESLPLWSTAGVDERHGGFHEALSFDAVPLAKPKRTRTMARQIYSFAMAKRLGWDGLADDLIDHGIRFLNEKGRTVKGGWVRTLNVDGSVHDPVEDTYDQAFVLLAMAHAHRAGHKDAMALGTETFAFIDQHLSEGHGGGFFEAPEDRSIRRSNPHMHLLEAFLAWHDVTGKREYLDRAARIVDLFRKHLFDRESWTLGENFDMNWAPLAGEKGQITEPGHHFEWVWLLSKFDERTGKSDNHNFGRRLYATAVANGINRSTGLAYSAVLRSGTPFERNARSWPQTEAVKAVIALSGKDGLDLTPEVEARISRLFRWHIDPAPKGLWVDLIDEKGKAKAEDVPASIFYHLICAFAEYLDFAGKLQAGKIQNGNNAQ
ncbi:MAG: AGE family epimerase/isomerase [Phyllobacterium sp.]